MTERLNILFVPNYNPDGNDQMNTEHRPSQEHCPHSVGQRRSGQDLDLNRDGVKMEGVETKGLFRHVIAKYKPKVFVDMHTTNGTWHANQLTFAHSYHTAGSGIVANYTRDSMLKVIQQTMLDSHAIQTNFYGNFYMKEGWPLQNYYTYNHHPRYLVNQFDLRNAIGILSETFAHDKFYTRIRSAYHFAKEILQYSYQQHRRIIGLCQESRKAPQTILSDSSKKRIGVRFSMKPRRKTIQLQTYDYRSYQGKNGQTKYVRSPLKVTHDSIRIHDRFEAVKTSIFPAYYIFSSSMSSIADILTDHGIHIDTLQDYRTISVDQFIIDQFDVSERAFEKHHMVNIDGQFTSTSKRFKKGDFLIRTDQELGFLLFYILEPQSDDGLITWNFFDAYFHKKGILRKNVVYPIYKIHTNNLSR